MAGHLEHSQTHDEASAGITPFPRPSPHTLVTNQERDKRCNGVRCARLVAGPGPPLYSASCAVTIHNTHVRSFGPKDERGASAPQAVTQPSPKAHVFCSKCPRAESLSPPCAHARMHACTPLLSLSLSLPLVPLTENPTSFLGRQGAGGHGLAAAATAPKTAPAPQPGHATREQREGKEARWPGSTTLLPHGRVVPAVMVCACGLQRGTVLLCATKIEPSIARSRLFRKGAAQNQNQGPARPRGRMFTCHTRQSMTSTRGRPGQW